MSLRTLELDKGVGKANTCLCGRFAWGILDNSALLDIAGAWMKNDKVASEIWIAKYSTYLRVMVFSWIVLTGGNCVLAHGDGDISGGFASGISHPVRGLDHVVAMLAVGLWGAQLGAPAICISAGHGVRCSHEFNGISIAWSRNRHRFFGDCVGGDGPDGGPATFGGFTFIGCCIRVVSWACSWWRASAWREWAGV